MEKQQLFLTLATLLIFCLTLNAQKSISIPRGKSISKIDDIQSIKLRRNNPSLAKKEMINISGQPFKKALRITVLKQPPTQYAVQLLVTKNRELIRKGDTIFTTFYIRCTKPGTENEKARFVFQGQKSAPPWKTFTKWQGLCGKEWTKIYACGIADKDYSFNEAQFTLNLGFHVQEIEVSDFDIRNLGKNFDQKRLPANKLDYEGKSKDAEWRKSAEKRIEQFRKGNLTVKIGDKHGKPINRADISLNMQRHKFLFGCFANYLIGRDGRGADKQREHFKKLFNCGTAPFYWTNEDNNWGWIVPKFRKEFMRIGQWLQDNDIMIRGHNIIWPAWRWTPHELKRLKNEPEKMKQIIDNRFEDILTKTKKFNIDQWDVINEPIAEHNITDILGRDVMVDWLKKTHSLDPETKLYINEYNILSYWGINHKKQDQYEELIKFLIDKRAPLHGIGLQCHFHQDLTGIDRILQLLNRFSKYKKDILITEFDIDIRDEQTQADYMRDFMTAIFSQPAVKGFIQWGFWEGFHPKPNAAIIRKDWTYKPGGEIYKDLVFSKWWTRAEGKTDDSGEFKTRGFLGDYIITIKKEGKIKEVPVELDKQENEIEITF